MRTLLNNKHLVNTAAGTFKFVVASGMFCFMLWKVPEQAANIIAYAGAFLLGGSKLREKIGL